MAFCVYPPLLVVHRYFSIRAELEYVVASAAAATSILRADEQQGVLDDLLRRLLPDHVLDIVDVASDPRVSSIFSNSFDFGSAVNPAVRIQRCICCASDIEQGVYHAARRAAL
jgi:hypothetical protein